MQQGDVENVCDSSSSFRRFEMKGTLMGTYSRNIIEYTDRGRYIPILFLLYSLGSLFGVPSKVPLEMQRPAA